MCYYFPGFTANLASFFILRECGKYNIIFYIFDNVYPWLIRVAQDYQGWSSICCLLVHLFTSVFWGHGIFSENRLPMAPRPGRGSAKCLRLLTGGAKGSCLCNHSLEKKCWIICNNLHRFFQDKRKSLESFYLLYGMFNRIPFEFYCTVICLTSVP